MAEIIEQRNRGWTYDVTVLADGEQYTFSFPAEPTDVQLTVDAEVARILQEKAAVTLADAQQAKLQALDAWYDAQAAQGVSVGSLTLAATVADQNRYTSLAAAEHLALTLGQRTLTDTSGLADRDGVWHTMALADLFAVLLQYAAVCQAWSAEYAAVAALIRAAESIDALNAIEVQ